MKNWFDIFRFTLKQALKGKKFLGSTVFTGIIILAAVAFSNIMVSGALGDDVKVNDVRAVYIVNNTDLTIDTDDFLQKHREEYPNIRFEEVTGKSAEEIAADPAALGSDVYHSLVLDISEKDEVTNLTVYIPRISNMGSDDSGNFAWDFKETIKNAKIKSTDISEDKMNMSISDINVSEVKAEEAAEEEEDVVTSVVASLVPMFIMLFLYIMVIVYGQTIGHVVSMEKTSKLMEYILTLTKPASIISGKVTAVFCEAVMQLAFWGVCGAGGFFLSNGFIARQTGGTGKNLIASIMEAVPEGTLSDNFAVLLILAIVATLVAFLFYCFVSALFASFASTPEELTQTNAMSLMTMLLGFFVNMYVPMFTNDAKAALIFVRLFPFSAAFTIPGDILTGRYGIGEFLLFLGVLIVFTVLLAILTGRVYKNRLFRRGTKGIFEEILAAITGKAVVKPEDEERDSAEETEKVYKTFENHDSAKKTFTIVGFALMAFMLGTNTIGSLVASVVVKMIAARKHMDLMSVYEDMNISVLVNVIAMYVIGGLLVLLVMKFTDDSKQVVKGHISKNQYARSIFMLFPVAVLFNYFSIWLASAVSGGQAENPIESMLTGENVLMMIMVAVLAPIFEELVFRKLIIDRTRRYGEWVAILYSSVAFGLFHCNIYQVIYAAMLGIILGYVYVRTSNVILTIIMHISINATSAILAPLSPSAHNVFVNIMLVLGTLSIIYTLIKRDVVLEPAVNEVPRKELTSLAFVNSGTVLFALACVVMMVYNLVM